MAHREKIIDPGRGNSTWGKPYVAGPHPITAFEQEVKNLQLLPEDYQASRELRSWCDRNANSRYVPEYLLKSWGIHVKEGWWIG